MPPSNKLIVIAEPNGFYRRNTARLIEEQTRIPVKEFVADGDSLQWFQMDESKCSQVCLVIAHAYFRNEFGERDYRRTGVLFQRARERWPDVALIALANSSFPIPPGPGYPEDVCYVDIDSASADAVPRAVDDLLRLSPLSA